MVSQSPPRSYLPSGGVARVAGVMRSSQNASHGHEWDGTAHSELLGTDVQCLACLRLVDRVE